MVTNETTTWPTPWLPIIENKTAILEELKSELGLKHVLFGLKIVPLAKNSYTDDVVVEILDSAKLSRALVHLTWSGKEETNPNFPSTNFYLDISDLLKKLNILFK